MRTKDRNYLMEVSLPPESIEQRLRKCEQTEFEKELSEYPDRRPSFGELIVRLQLLTWSPFYWWLRPDHRER